MGRRSRGAEEEKSKGAEEKRCRGEGVEGKTYFFFSPAPFLPCSLALFLYLSLLAETALCWEFRTHRMVNDQACHILPRELRGYFLKNKDYISKHSIDPDTILRDRWGYNERKKHFIDLEQYGFYPFNGIPYSLKTAIRIYGRELVNEHGILPWWIDIALKKLSLGLKKGNWNRAKKEAAYLGHYVADAFQPLHLTKNYDGQFTGNKGIHRRFEDLVERNLDEYQESIGLKLREALYLRDPLEFIFSNLRKNYLKIDVILKVDKEHKGFLLWDQRTYYSKMDIALKELTTEQLAMATHSLSSLWYTAWVDAGRPPWPRD